jgi:DNA modification methylase
MSKKDSKTRTKSVKALSPKPAARSKAAAEPKPVTVKITAAKGRPMLQWVGKRPLGQVAAFPAQIVERHDALHILGLAAGELDAEKHSQKMQVLADLRVQCNSKPWTDAPFPGVWAPEVGGLLYHGDNEEVLAHLLANGFRGAVDLVYIDPPFASGADYVRAVSLRGTDTATKLESGDYSIAEQIQYEDIWANDSYLQFMYTRLLLLRELLHRDGSIWLHCDYHKSHYLRCLLDEVFGPDGLRNEVIWQRTDPHNDATSRLGWVHDTLLWYSRGEATYNHAEVAEALSPAALREYSLLRLRDGTTVPFVESSPIPDGARRFKLDDCTWKGSERSQRFAWRGARPSDKRVWPYGSPEEMDQAVERGEFYLRDPERGAARCRVSFLDEREGQLLQTIWTECGRMKGGSDYPTQKPEVLLTRIVQACTEPGDLVLDCFIGSGTTAAVAQRLGRRWIGCDINKGAIQTTTKRLRSIIDRQIAESLARADAERQGVLPGMEDEPPAKPCQFGFTVYRVNDYDLQVQHNEAVSLACEAVGVERTRTDRYFDGTRGKALVKIIPFGHPLSPMDLEELKRELEARPDEDRAVTVVCLGMELAAKGQVDDWNRLRKGRDAPNRIDVIELRSDSRYGGFIRHEPAKARAKVFRKNGAIVVKIEDFVSPTIIRRLEQQEGVIKPTIDDWRQMVDCVMIDPSYDGRTLRVALADVPDKKSDFVKGEYELLVPDSGGATVAVKVVDMLGEEVLVTRTV